MIVFGGSFNPPHLGHFSLIKYVNSLIQKEKILIIPNYKSPLKEKKQIKSSHILKMLELNFESLNYIEISSIEIDNPNTSYSLHTIKKIQKIYPNEIISLIIGEDNYCIFHKWYCYKEILETISYLYVFKRFLVNTSLNLKLEKFNQKIKFLMNPLFLGNSSEIRKSLIIDKKPLHLKDSVLNYILKNRLYKV